MIFFRKDEQEPPRTPTEADDLKGRVQGAGLPEAVRKVVEKEIERLERTDPSVAEYTIGLNYVDFLLLLPWTAATEDDLDLARAEAAIDASHYGLREVKDRVLEYLAARALTRMNRSCILVVDDENIARTNLRHVLTREGHQVETAADGAEAVEKLARWDFDLIVTDLKMDRMDGMQLLETVKRLSPHTEVIMVTGYATVASAVEAMRTGAVHYLSKPVNLDELRAVVRQVLAGKSRSALLARSPVLCFTGPPGVGKTSVGRAVAEALGRKFHRMSLGDLRDEAELRGHRRTYAGAMPGRLMQALRWLGVRNPVFMLDEIDKIGQDVRGDPASALLEILDPDQNRAFVDHYVEVPFDVSAVLFIATANSVERLRGPLLDRLEVVHFPSYTESEKSRIAADFLVPRQLREHGLTHPFPVFTEEAVIAIIRDYTREAGLRGLEREIARVCRKLARIRLAEAKSDPAPPRSPLIDAAAVTKFLGPSRFPRQSAARGERRVGVATGLVYSEAGGEVILVEATAMKGSSRLLLTGSLGTVLRESARIALSYLRGNAERLGLAPGFFDGSDIHVHIPAGEVPKDGPSAGVTIAVALLSRLRGVPARVDTAFSGEMSLSGKMLRVSGVREKVLAAMRAGVARVALPAENAPDVEAMRHEIGEGVRILLINDAEEAFRVAFEEDAGEGVSQDPGA